MLGMKLIFDYKFQNKAMDNTGYGVFPCCFMLLFNYKRKIKRGAWSEKAMKKTAETVLEWYIGYMLVVTSFSVLQTTLERKVKKGSWKQQCHMICKAGFLGWCPKI